MTTLPPGYHLQTFEQIDSTNEEARRIADTASDRIIIWAKTQTAGRGRRGRAWMSTPGNLFMSVLVKPGTDIATSSQLSFVTALAVCDAVQPLLADEKITLKWPNDVLIDGAKVCGILLEASSAGNMPDAIIIGIGLNLVSHPEDTPYPAADLAGFGLSLTPDAALERIVHAFEARYTGWVDHGFAAIRTDWLARAHQRGGPIEVRLDRETLTGTFTDLDPSGALVLQPLEGAPRHITAGDVFFPVAE